jgi:hypothetical protein
MSRSRAVDTIVEGRPELVVRDEDAEAIADELAELLVDLVERELQEPA